MGVETVKILSSIPIEMLQNLLGKNGAELSRRANGIDETPVVPYHEQKSISTENTFDKDTIDILMLKHLIVGKLCPTDCSLLALFLRKSKILYPWTSTY